MNVRKIAIQAIVVTGLVGILIAVLLLGMANSVPASASSLPMEEARTIRAGNVITIGVGAALSGPIPQLGWQEVNAVQLAADQINAAGGVDIGGTYYTVAVVYADSACSAGEAVTAANELLDAGAAAVVGHTCSSASMEAQPIYAAAGVPMVSPSASLPDLTEQGYTTTFRTISRDGAGSALLATYLYNDLGLGAAAIVEMSGFGFLCDVFESTFTGLGGSITSRRMVSSTADFTATLSAIQAENPDAIYYADGSGDAGGLLSRIAYDLGMTDVVIAYSPYWGGEGALEDYVARAGGAAEGDIAGLTGRRIIDMPGYDGFNADYQAAGFPYFGDEAGMWGAFGYDTAQIVIAAIDRADSTDPPAIRDEIAAMADHEGVVGTYEGFDIQGDVIPQWAWLQRFESGRWFIGPPTPDQAYYVDGASGQDSLACGTTSDPCETISYALDRSGGDSAVYVAQGVYTENLTVDFPVTLEGGYEALSWTRSLILYETVIDGSNSTTVPGEWDGNMVAHPRVISDSGQYRMWYSGQDTAAPKWGWTLGLAESQDGLDWTKYGANPVLEPGEDGEWDSFYRGQAAIIVDGGLYHMWYSGSDEGPWQTGYATSTDGIDWNIYADNPVLSVGGEGSWDEQEADAPTIIKDGGLYHMWYHGCNPDYTLCSIGYATSTNGLDWSKYAGNPVLTGTAGEWDEGAILWPSVVEDGGTYSMWYYGGGGQIGLATSSDGVNWAKHAGNPVLTEGWDGVGIHGHTVILEGGLYRMWLQSGMEDRLGFGYAESPDGISWTMSISNPVLMPGVPTQWGDPVVRFEGGCDGAVLDGFTVTNGDAYKGSGVMVDGTIVTVQNCTVEDNRAWDAGAGIGMSNGANVMIANTDVISNVRWGGGGGGAGLWADSSTVVITDSIFQYNEATQHPGGGIGIWEGTIMTATNILVADNSNTGLLLHANCTAHVMNATIANNSGTGMDVVEASASAELVNGILYFNENTDLNCAGSCAVSYSDVGTATVPISGTGNISADPLFVGEGDYHLQVDSPCVDTGTPEGAPAHDLEGTPRDTMPDMGAYEWVEEFYVYLPVVVREP